MSERIELIFFFFFLDKQLWVRCQGQTFTEHLKHPLTQKITDSRYIWSIRKNEEQKNQKRKDVWRNLHVVNCVMSEVRGWLCFLCMEPDCEYFSLCVPSGLLWYSAFVAQTGTDNSWHKGVSGFKKKRTLFRDPGSEIWAGSLQFQIFNLRNCNLYPLALLGNWGRRHKEIPHMISFAVIT